MSGTVLKITTAVAESAEVTKPWCLVQQSATVLVSTVCTLQRLCDSVPVVTTTGAAFVTNAAICKPLVFKRDRAECHRIIHSWYEAPGAEQRVRSSERRTLNANLLVP